MHLCHYLFTDQIQEAKVELDTIRDHRELSLCTLMALVYAEKKKTNPGKTTFSHHPFIFPWILVEMDCQQVLPVLCVSLCSQTEKLFKNLMLR